MIILAKYYHSFLCVQLKYHDNLVLLFHQIYVSSLRYIFKFTFQTSSTVTTLQQNEIIIENTHIFTLFSQLNHDWIYN